MSREDKFVCGICGIVDSDSKKKTDVARLTSMRNSLRHRGPDDEGIWSDSGIGLGHTRLSILDVSEHGHQPMESDNGNFILVYNGEIYNFRELRASLESEGYRFHSATDTEVIVKGFEHWGLEGLLEKLIGIFAFAIWNKRGRELTLVRDHFGVKPLHWTERGGEFLFASEIKALFTAGFDRQIADDKLDELLMFRFAAGPNPPFKGIYRLLPGHYLKWRDGHISEHCYYSILNRLEGPPVSSREWFGLFEESVRMQKLSDVPIGTLLSGGLDSSAITAELAQSVGPGLKTFNVSVRNELDERPFAKKVAERWNCQFFTLSLDGDGVFDRYVDAQQCNDEPLAHGNDAHLHMICRLAQDHVKVLLSGEGADETLAGYVRYLPFRYPRILRTLMKPLGSLFQTLAPRGVNRLEKFARFLSLKKLDEYILFNAADVLPFELERVGRHPGLELSWRRDLLRKIMRVVRSPLKALMVYDLHTFLASLLDRNDRMTMGASVECRVPFLDYRLVEKALRIPEPELFANGQGKKPLRTHMSLLLPAEILSRAKWGFGVPLGDYLRMDGKSRRFLASLGDSDLKDMLGLSTVQTLISGFLRGDRSQEQIVRQFFFLGLWCGGDSIQRL